MGWGWGSYVRSPRTPRRFRPRGSLNGSRASFFRLRWIGVDLGWGACRRDLKKDRFFRATVCGIAAGNPILAAATWTPFPENIGYFFPVFSAGSQRHHGPTRAPPAEEVPQRPCGYPDVPRRLHEPAFLSHRSRPQPTRPGRQIPRADRLLRPAAQLLRREDYGAQLRPVQILVCLRSYSVQATRKTPRSCWIFSPASDDRHKRRAVQEEKSPGSREGSRKRRRRKGRFGRKAGTAAAELICGVRKPHMWLETERITWISLSLSF